MAYTLLTPQSGTRTAAQLDISITNSSGYTVTLDKIYVYGKVVFAQLYVTPSSAVSAGAAINPAKISGLAATLHNVSGTNFEGIVDNSGNIWVRIVSALGANTSYYGSLVALLP